MVPPTGGGPTTGVTSAVSPTPTVTILGFGSLLSERSSRMTFPTLSNFRLGRVPDHRRVFGHPAPIFFERGLADMSTLEISSLSAEPCMGSSFVCSVFDVPNDGFTDGNGEISDAFREREEEFDIARVPYTSLTTDDTVGTGILCCRWTDEDYVKRWGKDRFVQKYQSRGIDTIWGWKEDSGIRPCRTYLRHCLLAAKNMGEECHRSFLEETFLVDRVTTIGQYLEREGDRIWNSLPPPELADRYGG